MRVLSRARLFDGVTLTHAPAEPSKIVGLDGKNAPNGIAFKNMTWGGVPVNARNYDDYFNIDEECFNITFDGRGV